jgi:hypothetical protein
MGIDARLSYVTFLICRIEWLGANPGKLSVIQERVQLFADKFLRRVARPERPCGVKLVNV